MTMQTTAEWRKRLTPEIERRWRDFSRSVFKPGALDAKTKQLIALAVAHVTQCPYCLQAHTQMAEQKGASEQEILEAIWVAAEMRAGGAVAHSHLAFDAMEKHATPGAET